jgi:antitoxin (DNA-binding transcriptional repressor) of toxin-antitoxin stability system
MTSVSLHEAKTHLSSLVAGIERKGEKIIIFKHGRAVAELGPVSSGSRLKTDKVLKKVQILGDLTAPTTGEWENV